MKQLLLVASLLALFAFSGLAQTAANINNKPDVASPPPQRQPSLQITSPASGTTVSPGQTVTVTVTSPVGLTFSEVDVIGEFPIGMSTVAKSVPAQIPVTIPSSIACGPRVLTAEGTTASGASAESASITIDVERPDFPVSLSASFTSLTLESQGETTPFVFFAKFSDGAVLRVNESSYVTYTSSNTAIATVDTFGKVTAVGPGETFVVAQYTLGSLTNQISIPVSVQLPMLTASPSSLTFASQSVGTTSRPQRVTLSNVSGGTLSILSISASSDFSETDNCVASSPLGSSGTCVANVTFSPTAAGARAGTLTISNSANTVPMSLSPSGTGTTAPWPFRTKPEALASPGGGWEVLYDGPINLKAGRVIRIR